MSKTKHYDVIVAPVVTEKSTMASEHNQVVFDVAIDSTKPQIKAAIEALFSVKVKAVNVNIRKGKTKKFRGINGRRKDVKKAIVTLVEGQVIDIASGL
ncbi:MAG TPA: 50S ribosomal protein L23 [Devosia sp.]|nr:50S ribosomal protein L23 [Devosia sp.]